MSAKTLLCRGDGLPVAGVAVPPEHAAYVRTMVCHAIRMTGGSEADVVAAIAMMEES
jgi:hypothetical protein